MKVYRVEYESYTESIETWTPRVYTGVDATVFTRLLAGAEEQPDSMRITKTFIGNLEEVSKDEYIDINTLTKVLL